MELILKILHYFILYVVPFLIPTICILIELLDNDEEEDYRPPKIKTRKKRPGSINAKIRVIDEKEMKK